MAFDRWTVDAGRISSVGGHVLVADMTISYSRQARAARAQGNRCAARGAV